MSKEILSDNIKNTYDNQRILHDASLIMQGAAMKAGRLSITDAQYDYLKLGAPDIDPVAHREADKTQKLVGTTVLRLTSSAEVELHRDVAKTTSDWSAEIANREALTETISAVIEPYRYLLAGLVPSRDELKRGMFGKVKERQASHVSYTDVERDNTRYQYRFQTQYSQGAETSTLERTNIRFIQADSNQFLSDEVTSKGKIEPSKKEHLTGGYVNIGMKDGLIADVHAQTPHSGTQLLFSAIYTMPFFQEFPQELLAGSRCDKIDFSLDGPKPCLTLSGRSAYRHETVTYTYDSENDHFVLDDTNASPNASRPSSVSVESFMKALETTLGVIPTQATIV